MIRAALLAMMLPTCVVAQSDADAVRAADRARLAAFDATAGKALLQALAGGTRGDVDLLQDILTGAPLAPLATALAGDWSCRTLKLGGPLTDLVVYAPFDCTIAADGAAFTIEKSTGSQRMTGRIALIDGDMILTATGFVADTPAPAYADLPPANESDGTIWPIVGRVVQPDPDRIRILMPQPVLESDLDILDLRRKAPPPIDAAPEAQDD